MLTYIMTLSNTFQRTLVAKSHTLKPVVRIGSKGLTDNIHQEVDAALTKHELIKISVVSSSRPERTAFIQSVVAQSASHPVLSIGNVVVLYRKKPEKKKR